MAGQDGLRVVTPSLRALIAASDQYRRALAVHLGISVPEVIVLEYLYHDEPLTPTAIAERLGITTASMTGLLDRLVHLGYLSRSPNPQDRRSILVTLTGDGRDVMRPLCDQLATDVEKTTAGTPGPVRFLQLITGVLHQQAQQLTGTGRNEVAVSEP